jgi:intermediate cleaving peptidase 55
VLFNNLAFPVSGKFTESQKQLYEIVLNSQKQMIAQCVIGNSLNFIQNEVYESMRESLQKLFNKSIKRMVLYSVNHLGNGYVISTSCWALFGIGCSVFLLLIFSDTPSVSRSRPLEAGMVVTIEVIRIERLAWNIYT